MVVTTVVFAVMLGLFHDDLLQFFVDLDGDRVEAYVVLSTLIFVTALPIFPGASYVPKHCVLIN